MRHLEEIKELLIRHFRQKLDADDAACLDRWLNQSEKNRLFFEELNDARELMASIRLYDEMKQIDMNEAWKKMKTLDWNCVSKPEEIQTGWWKRIAVAASVVLCVFAGIHVFRQVNKPPDFPVVVKGTAKDVAPGEHPAVLTLENGEKIKLDRNEIGLLATQGGSKVMWSGDGLLRYSGEAGGSQQLVFNTVTVPKGSDVLYLQLNDGSKVWVNAGSSIRYPVLFTNDERMVEITGEAYFEVANSDRVKFTVSKGNMSVIVQGTKFNVNAYENEAKIKVTLLEGSVKVKLQKEERTIKPGQQAILGSSDIDVVNDVDMCAVVAWKEGKYLY